MRNIKPLKDIDLDLNILDNNKLDKKKSTQNQHKINISMLKNDIDHINWLCR